MVPAEKREEGRGYSSMTVKREANANTTDYFTDSQSNYSADRSSNQPPDRSNADLLNFTSLDKKKRLNRKESQKRKISRQRAVDISTPARAADEGATSAAIAPTVESNRLSERLNLLDHAPQSFTACSKCRHHITKQMELHVRRSEKEWKAAGKTTDASNIFTTFRTMFKNLFDSKKDDKTRETLQSRSDVAYLNVISPQHPIVCTSLDQRCVHNVVSLNSQMNSDYIFHRYTNISSSVSPCSTSTSSNYTADPSCWYEEEIDSLTAMLMTPSSTCCETFGPLVDYDTLKRRNPRLKGKGSHSRPKMGASGKSRSLDVDDHNREEDLCSSWPLSGKRLFVNEYENDYFGIIDDVIIDRQRPADISYEYNIPFADIVLRELIKPGKHTCIYKGEWHGDVCIHAFMQLEDKHSREKFWMDVEKLGSVRHENIALFMGVSSDPPNFYVIMSPLKYKSLFDKIHTLKEKTTEQNKLNVLRQLSLAISYLHAKNICVRRLNSRNVYMETKTTLCLLDHSLPPDIDERPTFVPIPDSLIWYAAPELLAICGADQQRFVPETACTQATDVYAFGTMMYEIFACKFPFSHLTLPEVIAKVCNVATEEMTTIPSPQIIKSLVQLCWSYNPTERPNANIVSRLLQNSCASTIVRRSSSEPESIHQFEMDLSYDF